MTRTSKRSEPLSEPIAVYLEIGKKRILAGARDWPGWCRGGRDEVAAIQALMEYGPRYERVLHASGLRFQASTGTSAAYAFEVVERVEGNTTTDFGAPDVAPSSDDAPVDTTQLLDLQTLLKACWSAFDSAVQAAVGKDLRKGPRGGGRDLLGVVQHTLGAETSYLSRLGGKLPNRNYEGGGEYRDDPVQILKQQSDIQQQVILDALGEASRGELALRGPRGGIHWTPRFFVRRAAWHILDHIWEMEDRVL